MKYEDIDALNWSTLKEISVSPAWMRHLADHPEERKDKPSYRRGRVIHCATLEPDELHKRYVVEPDFAQLARDKFGDLKTRDAREYRDNLADEWYSDVSPEAEKITQEEMDTAIRCAEAIHSHPVAAEYLKDAVFESTVQWKSNGVKCKGRVDAAARRIVDLKSTRHFDLRSVMFDAVKYNYHTQLAWYHDGAFLNGMVEANNLPVMIAVAQSPQTSFVDVAVVDMANYRDTFEAGRAHYTRNLLLYKGCLMEDRWPGMAHGVVPWEIPDWKKEKQVIVF